jgi:3-isopropylmalate/(R)-2-methylmalate dehydratase small subunit
MDTDIRQGRIWVLLDKDGRIIEDIDTDQIFHNAHLAITDRAQMGPLAFGNLEGWKDFPGKCGPGDIIIAGRNFGAGSSRQQAVDCFLALKVGAVLAPSFSAIYFRNAVNSGFPVLNIPGLDRLLAEGTLASGDIIRVDVMAGRGDNLTRKIEFPLDPMSGVQYDIYRAGDLFKYGKTADLKKD